MRRIGILTIIAGAILLCGETSLAKDGNMIANGDFSSDISGIGVCYSSGQDTVMPFIRYSSSIFKDGGTLEFFPGETLYEEAGTGPLSGGVAYQGIYHDNMLTMTADTRYNISADVNSAFSDINMRFIITSNGRLIEMSDPIDVSSDIWNNVNFSYIPEIDLKNVRIRAVFYNITYGRSIYLDNFTCKKTPVAFREWKPISDEKLKLQDRDLVFGASAKQNSGIFAVVDESELEEGEEYALAAELSTQADKAYMSLTAGNESVDFVVKNGEKIKVHLPFYGGDETMLKVTAFCNSDANITVSDASVIDKYSIIHVERAGNKINVSGCLREGNEGNEISISMGDLGNYPAQVDEQGRYALSCDVPDISDAEKDIRIVVSNIKGYADFDNELSVNYKIKNTNYSNEIANKISGVSKEQVESELTEEVLDNLGVSAIRAIRTAKTEDIYTYMAGKTFSDGDEMIAAITTAGVLSSLNAKTQKLCNMTDEYKELLKADKSSAYNDLYENADKTSLNDLFEECTIAIKDDASYRKALAETLIRNEMKSTSNYSQQLSLLQTYSEELGLDFTEFNKLSSDKQYNVGTQLVEGIKNKKSYSDLQSKIDSLSKAAGANTGGGQMGGQSGGSSKGNSGSNVSVQTPIAQTKNRFEFWDMSDYEWAAGAVYALTESGIISEAEDHMFNPASRVTRAEMAKMTALMFGMTGVSKNREVFKDVTENDWYYTYVMALYENKIINGISDDEFGSSEPITRQDICVILARLLGTETVEDELPFNDMENAADYAIDSIALMSSEGIINGYDDGSFRPMAYATRAEIAQVLYRISSAMGE